MGVNALSFSIAWTRILPFGNKGSPVSQEGLKFVRFLPLQPIIVALNVVSQYDDFIDELLKNGIEPIATLFHW